MRRYRYYTVRVEIDRPSDFRSFMRGFAPTTTSIAGRIAALFGHAGRDAGIRVVSVEEVRS